MPLHHGWFTPELRETTIKRLKTRVPGVDFDQPDPVPVKAIFVLNDPHHWEVNIQVICDLASTVDGTIAQVRPEVGPERHLPVYCL